MEITATVHTAPVTANGVSQRGEWKKTTVIAKWMDGQYECFLALDNMKKADEFARLIPGQLVKFSFDVTSREHGGKWYTSANCWKWEVQGQAMGMQPQQFAQQPMQQPMQQQPFGQPFGQPMQQPFNIPGQ